MTQVVLKTSFGDIKIALHAEKAPKTVENFINYVKDDFFNGLIFHRVIDGFMVQGGGMHEDMTPKAATQGSIENEADNGLSNKTGTLAMARTMDPHSASSQFFINVKDNTFLDHSSKTPEGWGYCVFGEVVEGMDVVNRIKGVRTTMAAGHQDVPAEPILIESAELVE
ncbi:peptidylprolyl isomerase [Bermanella sp. R86510]|uniref:peptidylprolyl isomerase n=1 Tax=unclassified Bermanella TaxID=2627862 RepID=UPI0037C62934